ncbi:large ribosomal subunit protein mL49-like [Physella acuta]|uniref:large ribosomal subunit protein mL49-like n=1 Tax=Physella acuta TaxID=109671 RepID=UPI0027DBB432|nr:large ribosomal subunit protein mL49-like [Physella acuta]
MAAYGTFILRTCTKCTKNVLPVFSRLTTCQENTVFKLTTARFLSSLTHLQKAKYTPREKPEYIENFEVSYDEFKYVEPLLPKAVVPEAPQHEMYPTASGWVPPNDELISKQTFLVRRTKNHMLPVYPEKSKRRVQLTWKINHSVIIKKIEGDIWSLECQLREYLQNKTGITRIRTQVHEVARFIRIRGMHTPLVAEFLLERGM